jgi:hypothetical protein
MKSVLISIQPKWCELIASGKKTVEVRKTKPKLETPFKVYIYCTKGKFEPSECLRNNLHYDDSTIKVCEGQGKIIGEFVCDEITEYEGEFYDDETYENIKKVIHTTDWDGYPEIDYNFIAENGEENSLCKSSCLTWEELRKYIGQGINIFYGWHISDLVIYDKPRELSEFYIYCGDNPKCDGCEAHYFSNTECGKEDYCCSIIDGCKPLKRPPQSWCYVESEGEE